MAHQDITGQPSRAELIKLIFEQQLRLQTLQAALPRQGQSAAGEKTANHHWRGVISYLFSSQPQSWLGKNQPTYPPKSDSTSPPIYTEIMLELRLQQKLKQFTHLLLVKQHKKFVKKLITIGCYCNKGVCR